MTLRFTRRGLIAGTSAGTIVVPARASQMAGRNAWNEALAVYLAACGQHEGFLRNMLDPAWRSARLNRDLLQIRALEEQAGRFADKRADALQHLINIPAPGFGEARWKLRLAYHETLKFSDDGFLGPILADLDRIAIYDG